jgi:hypothetical protein
MLSMRAIKSLRSRIRVTLAFYSLLAVCMVASAAASGAPPAPDVNLSAWLTALYTAVTSKEWSIVTGFALILLVYPIRRFGPQIFKSNIGGKVIAATVSILGTLGIAYEAGMPVTLQLVFQAVSTAVVSAGVWEWVKDHVPGVQAAAEKAALPKATALALPKTVIGAAVEAAVSDGPPAAA